MVHGCLCEGVISKNGAKQLCVSLQAVYVAFQSVTGPKYNSGTMNMHPLGDQCSTNSPSLFLCRHDPKELHDPESGMMIELTVSILDKKHGQHFAQGRFVFAMGDKFGWGWSDFIALNTFKDKSRGYLIGSNCILKADITLIGSSNDG
ncbi:hypothetical protein BS78_01G203200 [Paspalum vaginatum]|nr:hypothetical protein BS78_01G203200 [Paspalum vaginatum]